MSPVLETPVVFIVFNRPEVTARVFARIRNARPTKLFLVADGPRPGRPHDVQRCQEVRDLLAAGIDWECEVVRDYSDVNLGCGQRVASGITNAFRYVEEAIILEDDCLPDPSFFRFCAELLERYRDEPRIGSISGSHHQFESARAAESYYFCRYGNIWGWATWRRAWEKFDYEMKEWPAWRDTGGVEALFGRREVRKFWRRIWDETAAGRYDTWDYQWTWSYLRHGMLGVLPHVSLIQNIGFGSDATHTISGASAAGTTGKMDFPLRHPAVIAPDLAAEERASTRFFSEKPLVTRAWAKLGRLASKLSLGAG